MEKALLAIVVMVFLVGLVGFLTSVPIGTEPPATTVASDSLTGNVVVPAPAQQPSDECSHCTGSMVCAGKDGKAYDYPNACAARCDGARILYDAVCERIPTARSAS